MRAGGYGLLVHLSGVLGLWVVRVAAAIIAVGYFVFLPRRLAGSLRFYRALFPERGAGHALACAWRQYQDFARLFSERLEIERQQDITFDSEGEPHLAAARAAGRGAILVMSHFGRWEIGARLLAWRREELTLVMGGIDAGRARGGIDVDLRSAGVKVLTVAAGQERAFDILQAVEVLRAGDFVSLAADRAYGEARRLRLPFLGHQVSIAVAPFALALATGAPLLVVFAVKQGRRHYRFVCHDPVYLTAPSRDDRQKVIEAAAAAYLARLQAMARAYPEQWQNFGAFLG